MSLFEKPFLPIVVIKHAANRPIACEQSERISPVEIAKFSKGALNGDLQSPCTALRAAPIKRMPKNNGCLKIRQMESEG